MYLSVYQIGPALIPESLRSEYNTRPLWAYAIHLHRTVHSDYSGAVLLSPNIPQAIQAVRES